MKFFGAITEKLDAIQKLDATKILHSILKDREFAEYVLDLNRQNQLFDEGINSEGEALSNIGGGYSKRTQRIKRGKGQPINRVTLKDTGDFYASFAIKTNSKGFDIVADTVKEDSDLTERWGKEILGLTDESKMDLVFRLVPLYQEYLRKKLAI